MEADAVNSTYPNLDLICRLCLQENVGIVDIFPSSSSVDDQFSSLSIPMRVMACAALEVQKSDELPKRICNSCRYLLEKSYYFRKRCQASDAKLRKHVRLINLGKISRVFANGDDDDFDIELELEDSLKFLRNEEDKQALLEKEKKKKWQEQIKLENEQELRIFKEDLEAKCILKVKSEVERELENSIRHRLQDECLQAAKEKVRTEVMGQCRETELKSLLLELQVFLTEKKGLSQNQQEPFAGASNIRKTRVSPVCFLVSEEDSNLENPNFNKVQPLHIEQIGSTSNNDIKNDNSINLKSNTAINHRREQQQLNLLKDAIDNDLDFCIYDETENEENVIDENKSTNDENKDPKNPDKHIERIAAELHIYQAEDADDHVNIKPESHSITTSYQIEDGDNGEINFYKKTNHNNRSASVDDSSGNANDENIMIINFADDIEEEHLDVLELNDMTTQKSFMRNSKPTRTKRRKIVNDNSGPAISPSKLKGSPTKVLTTVYTNPHQRTTDTPKTFKCENCPMLFSTKPSLERHLRTHRKIEEKGVIYQCPLCQIVVSCTSALRRHMFVHLDQKPFVCKDCGKAFVQREILKRHRLTHTGVKPHACPHCSKTFCQRSNLTQHINRVHLEVPQTQHYSCHLCPKRFKHASGLSRHLAAHTGLAFQCCECERTFGDRSSVKRHIVNVHGKSQPSQSVNTITSTTSK